MRGHIRRRGTRSWAIVLDLGTDEVGKRQQKWHSVKGTRKEAQQELTRLLNALDTGSYVEPTRVTAAEYLKRWLEDSARPNVSAKTFERYEEIVRLHLIPALGAQPLSKLKPLHIQGHYSQALQLERKGGKTGLSGRTVLHHHRVLHAALQQAVRWRMLARNPADAVEPPRARRTEMRALDEKQTGALLKLTRGTWLHAPIVLAVTTGLRRGELLGLRWQDVKLQTGQLSVRQTIEQTKKALTFKEPKTAKGRRVVALPPLAVEILRLHKVEQSKNRLILGPGYDDHGLVFARADGRPLDPRSVSHAFAELIRKSDLPRIRLHDLRHTHATQLLTQRVHPKIVSERLGHSTVAITLDTYSHVLPGMQEEAAQLINAMLKTALGTDYGS